jgi:hypothetical protein
LKKFFGLLSIRNLFPVEHAGHTARDGEELPNEQWEGVINELG